MTRRLLMLAIAMAAAGCADHWTQRDATRESIGSEMDKAVEVRKRLLAKHPGVTDAETIESEIYYLSRFPKLRDEGTLKSFFDLAGAAKVQAKAKRWDEAVVTIGKVLELVPDDPDHWTDLGIAQRNTGCAGGAAGSS